MNRKYVLLVVLTIFFLIGVMSANPGTPHKTLQVKLNYTGLSAVDEKHKIFVLLFDANPYLASTLIDSTSATKPPVPTAGVSHILWRLSAASKSTTITFSDVRLSLVFAAAFVDKTGTYDGHSDPISGAPVGVYGKAPDNVTPITLEEGKTVDIVIAFDDSAKTP